MKFKTLTEYLSHWNDTCPDKIWLRDLKESGSEDVTWGEAYRQISSMATVLEQKFGHSKRMVVLSQNRAHWILADLAIITSGNITVSLFTTLPASTANYIIDFTEANVFFIGEASNWEGVREILPKGATLITLPGVSIEEPHLQWDEIVNEPSLTKIAHKSIPDDIISLVFTSGTTGNPKGVIQTHESNIIPVQRFIDSVGFSNEEIRYFSYLPLAHIAERQIVEFSSLLLCGEIFFNESIDTLARDLPVCRPNVFFGPPRIWEQLQQAIIGKFGGQEAFDAAMEQDKEGIGQLVLQTLGLDKVEYCLAAAAPTPPPLIAWWESLGLLLMEGFGQTEAMGLIVSTREERRLGSIGKPIGEVEYKITEANELAVKADGCTPGYYLQPEKTAELIKDGWLYTGDKVRVDEDGFIYITGRVKDYFKTIHGKFVAPVPIEGKFAENSFVEQQCLLGRGFSKTVMVGVLTDEAQKKSTVEIEDSIRESVIGINLEQEKHAHIGAVILSKEAWSVENEVLTPTMKIRRDRVEEQFGVQAEDLARTAAEAGELLIIWDSS